MFQLGGRWRSSWAATAASSAAYCCSAVGLSTAVTGPPGCVALLRSVLVRSCRIARGVVSGIGWWGEGLAEADAETEDFQLQGVLGPAAGEAFPVGAEQVGVASGQQDGRWTARAPAGVGQGGVAVQEGSGGFR